MGSKIACDECNAPESTRKKCLMHASWLYGNLPWCPQKPKVTNQERRGNLLAKKKKGPQAEIKFEEAAR